MGVGVQVLPRHLDRAKALLDYFGFLWELVKLKFEMVHMRNYLHPRIPLLKKVEKSYVGMVGYQIL
jgi:hypothetical protein